MVIFDLGGYRYTGEADKQLEKRLLGIPDASHAELEEALDRAGLLDPQWYQYVSGMVSA